MFNYYISTNILTLKLLFCLLFSTASFSLSAQQLGPNTDKQIEESIRERIEKLKARKMAPSHPLLKPEPPQAHVRLVPEKPGVYALPQDGMPCVVPDTNSIAAMPNAAPLIYPYRKDMPARPYRKDIPDVK